MKLLSINNPKTIKGEKKGVKTYILYMTPYTHNSKSINLCPHASAGCAAACLVGSGFGGMYTSVQKARLAKTEYFLSDRIGFLYQLEKEVRNAIKTNNGKYQIAIRLNGTTDIRYEKFIIRDGKNIFELFPQVQWYDYTKNYLRFDAVLPANYHLTFSRSETNHDKALELLSRGFNVAIVFDTPPAEYMGYKVIDGDEDDLRFIGEKGVIIGLKYKKLTGKGADNTSAFTSGFAIKTA